MNRRLSPSARTSSGSVPRRHRPPRGVVAFVVVAGAALCVSSVADAGAPRPVVVQHPTAATSVVGLSLGSEGPGVAAVQEKLVGFGYVLSGGANGIFGASTEIALRHFQTSSGLHPTGVVTETTARYLGLAGGVTSTAATPNTPAPADAPAANGSPASPAGLRRGNTGDAVRQLQTAILRTGLYLSGGVDGVFGSSTERAVEFVQHVNGITETGVVTDATARVLGLTATSPTAPAAPSPLSAPPSPASGYIGLKMGSYGPPVRDLQRALMATGMTLRGGADGVFGRATHTALVAYQRVNGLVESGVVDATTARLMGLGGESTDASSRTSTSSGTSSGGGYASYDERGPRVSALQQALVNAGISVPGGVDGVFGSGTAGAIVKFQQGRGLPLTGRVNTATAQALGLTGLAAPAPAPAPPAVTLQAKPVGGTCWYGDTWQAARGAGRVHLGTDIGGAEGTPLRSVVAGRISYVYHDRPGSLSGNAVKVAMSDGTYFFYAHLSGFGPGIEVGVPVTAGQVIGYMGHTGNAAISHLHFEVHPGGGSAVNPYGILRANGAC